MRSKDTDTTPGAGCRKTIDEDAQPGATAVSYSRDPGSNSTFDLPFNIEQIKLAASGQAPKPRHTRDSRNNSIASIRDIAPDTDPVLSLSAFFDGSTIARHDNIDSKADASTLGRKSTTSLPEHQSLADSDPFSVLAAKPPTAAKSISKPSSASDVNKSVSLLDL